MAMHRDACNFLLAARAIHFDSDPLSVDERQIDAKGGTTPGLAGHVDEAAVVRHDSVGDREAESGALALFLGGKKRLEDSALCSFVHSQSPLLPFYAGVIFFFCVS